MTSVATSSTGPDEHAQVPFSDVSTVGGSGRFRDLRRWGFRSTGDDVVRVRRRGVPEVVLGEFVVGIVSSVRN